MSDLRPPPVSEAASLDRIDYDQSGDLDDVVLNDVSVFRMERMDNGLIWIRCYRVGKPDVVFWLGSQSKITGRHEYD
jgi:hypothetical protein